MRRGIALPLAFAVCAWAAARAQEPFQIDADIPGGNIVVQRIEGDRVDVHQDLRDTQGDWFYWHFRVRGAAGRTLTFRFTQGNVFAARGPAVSDDAGQTWRWLGREATDGTSFRYAFPPSAADVRFCLAMPYQQADLARFLDRFRQSGHLIVEPHARTARGREIVRLRAGCLQGKPQHRVLLTARHHSCEMMASYVLEGLLESVLSDETDGAWLRAHGEFLAVPLMDLDGVEDGDQGKNRRPHDPNRDYVGESIYPSVAELRRFVPQWAGGKLRVAIDLHCPYIRGRRDEQIFFVGGPDPRIWAETLRLAGILQETRTGTLPYGTSWNIPHGQEWNNLAEPRSCSRWAATLPGIDLATSLEIPYASAGGEPVTPDSARALGRDLARALRQYLASE